jgi:hypothetical protein
MLNNAIESEDNYPDSRKRRYHFPCNPERLIPHLRWLRSLDYGRFPVCQTPFLNAFLQRQGKE